MFIVFVYRLWRSLVCEREETLWRHVYIRSFGNIRSIRIPCNENVSRSPGFDHLFALYVVLHRNGFINNSFEFKHRGRTYIWKSECIKVVLELREFFQNEKEEKERRKWKRAIVNVLNRQAPRTKKEAKELLEWASSKGNSFFCCPALISASLRSPVQYQWLLGFWPIVKSILSPHEKQPCRNLCNNSRNRPLTRILCPRPNNDYLAQSLQNMHDIVNLVSHKEYRDAPATTNKPSSLSPLLLVPFIDRFGYLYMLFSP